jgi:phosphopantetheine adenylyltransferase
MYFIKDAIKDLDPGIRAKIHIDFVHGLVQDYCTKHNIVYQCKPGRNDQDRYDEMQQAYYNSRINPSISTKIDITNPDDPLLSVSSSAEK